MGVQRIVLVAVSAAVAAALAAGAGAGDLKPKPKPPLPAVTALAPDPYASVLAQFMAFPQVVGGKDFYCGEGNGPYVAFTFDDGPGPLTQQLLDFLKSQHVPATFFVIGRYIAGRESIVKEESQIGVVGDHTWDHPQLPLLESTPGAVLDELQRGKQAIEAVTGRTVSLFRPPFGQQDATIDGIARSLGLLDVGWSVGISDGASADDMYTNLLDGRVVGGSIVLMHENDRGEIEAFERALPVLLARGIVPVTVPQLLKRDPPTGDLPSRGGQCQTHWTPPTTSP